MTQKQRVSLGGHQKLAKLTTNFWLIATLVIMTSLIASVKPQILDVGNIATILRSFSILVVMVLGVTWVMAAGQIDISFMQVAAFANMLAAALLENGWGWGGAISISLGVGMFAGLINGLLIAYMRLPALIVTISMAGICGSAAAALGKGTVIRIADPGPIGGLFYTSIFGIIPVIILPVLVLAGLIWYIQEKLAVGRYIYAMAQNEVAVKQAGVQVARLTVLLFIFSAACAAMAGIMLAANLSSGQPTIGGPYLINGLTVVLLGGMMVYVGKPNILGTLTATLFIGVLFSGAALLGLPDYQRQIIQGLLLAAGLSVATFASRHHSIRNKGTSHDN
ncbi:MAG: ABC transporter permease [Rhizobiales bacterium]|nr:ABC transporter permease [Hyphomicrobiales bacterium]